MYVRVFFVYVYALYVQALPLANTPLKEFYHLSKRDYSSYKLILNCSKPEGLIHEG